MLNKAVSGYNLGQQIVACRDKVHRYPTLMPMDFQHNPYQTPSVPLQVTPVVARGEPVASAYYGFKHKALTVFLGIVALVEIAIISQIEHPISIVVAILIAAMWLALALEFWLVRIEMTSTMLLCYSPWRKNRAIPLCDIYQVDFGNLPQWFYIRTHEHGIVRLHGYLKGLYSILDAVEKNGTPYPRVRHVR